MEEYWRKFKYPSAYKLYQIMKKEGNTVTLSEVDKFVSSKRTHQLHKKTRHNIQDHIVAFTKNGLWFADLLDMQNFSRQNKGFKYILLCIDVFTRSDMLNHWNQNLSHRLEMGLIQFSKNLIYWWS